MVCRLCLIDCETKIFIYSEENIQKNIAKFLQIELWPEDPVSKVICARCCHQLNDFQAFCFEIEQAQKTLNTTIEKSGETTFPNGSSTAPSTEPHDSEIIPEQQLKEEKTENQANDCESLDLINFVNEDTKDLLDIEETRIQPSFIDSPKTNDSIQTRRVTRQSVLQTFDRNNIPQIINDERNASKEEQSKTNESTEEDEVEESKKGPKAGTKSKRKCNGGKKQITSEEKAARSEKYLRHMQMSKESDEIIRENMTLSCDICSIKFSNFTELKLHFRVNHQRRGYALCCDKKLFKRAAIVDHIKCHTDPKFFRCKECGKVMADRSSMQRHHIMFHPPENMKTFPCDNCPEKFVTQYLLNLHSVKHVEKNDFICNECGKAFPTNYTLSEHVKRRHTTVYDRMCEICAKLVRGKGAFDRHMKEHEGILQPQAQCLECGSWLKDKNSLRKHIYSKHDGKTHMCDVCGKTAPSKSALYSHIKYMHELSPQFHCTFCDKSFKKAIHLREHTATHTGEVLYTCPHCPATFNAQANMHSHRKKMHREEWEANRRCDKKRPTS